MQTEYPATFCSQPKNYFMYDTYIAITFKKMKKKFISNPKNKNVAGVHGLIHAQLDEI